MDVKRIGIISNVHSGSGREKVLDLTKKAFDCVLPQVQEVFVGPGDMGEVVCKGPKVKVLGIEKDHTRYDTIETARQMVENGVEMFVIVSGDGTYNDALEGMKSLGVTLPILGIAGGRFNTIFPKRVHDPFVSMRGEFRPFKLEDVAVEDVIGLLSKVNGKIVSYGFFWGVVSNIVAYSDAQGNMISIDAAKYLKGEAVQVTSTLPVANKDTRVVVNSAKLGVIELVKGDQMSMPIVAHIVPEINQIMSGGFGAISEVMGFNGVAYYFKNPAIAFFPTPNFFPVDMAATAFFAGDQVEYTHLNDHSVYQVDSTAICEVNYDDVLTVEVDLSLGKKAVIKRS